MIWRVGGLIWFDQPPSRFPVGPIKKPPPVGTGGGKVGNTYSSRGARVTDTTAIAATLIAKTERSADLVTRRFMRRWETGKIRRGRQAQDCCAVLIR